MKAADIDDVAFLRAVQDACETRSQPGAPSWATTWDLQESSDLASYPRKIIIAKARALIRRGLLDGCPCGCRGDFTVIGSDQSIAIYGA